MRNAPLSTLKLGFVYYFLFMMTARRVAVRGFYSQLNFSSVVTFIFEIDALAIALKFVSSLFVCMLCCPTSIMYLIIFFQKFRRK